MYDSDGNHERIDVASDARAQLYVPKSISDLKLQLRAIFAKIDIPE